MAGVHAIRSHSYTSLRDVVACSVVAASNKQWSSHVCPPQSPLADIRHVHMRNPLLEKAARAYLATATSMQRERHASGMSSSFSFFLRIVGFPFNSLFGGASAWFRQLYIKI